MTVVGERPSHGIRLRLVQRRGERSYEGTSTTPHEQWAVRADVSSEAGVEVTTTAPGEIAEWIRRVVRIAARGAASEGVALPRVIQRWRADQ
ncbi:MAG TPA: hypothetical protein VLM85_00935 [Polyangiaceae bacterium]|nr:hypothetical protein [Polyangiaceae bacterium]